MPEIGTSGLMSGERKRSVAVRPKSPRLSSTLHTDQGSQFTSAAFTSTLESAGIKISMDGRGRWMDNVFIERLWRSLKHEDVYLRAMPTGRRPRWDR